MYSMHMQTKNNILDHKDIADVSLYRAGSCAPLTESQLDWLMLTPSLPYHQATAGVEWQ